MSDSKKKTTTRARAAIGRASSATEPAAVERLLLNELTAASYKVAAFEALIAGHLADALEHIDDAVRLYELNPSYAKRSAGQFHTLSEFLGACVETHEAWKSPSALCALDLFTRMEKLGRAGIH